MNNLTIGTIGIILMCFLPHIISDWHIRMVFVPFGVNCSGSYKKRLKYYKQRYSKFQRILLLSLLDKSVGFVYKIYFVLHYSHLILSIFTIINFVATEYIKTSTWINWQSTWIITMIISVIEILIALEIPHRN